MVPLKDDNPTQITPYVTYVLVALNVLAFLYELTLSQPQLEQFFQAWAVVPRELTASFDGAGAIATNPEWITLFSSQFLHGGFLHIAGNMLYLWIFGNNVEDRLGHAKFVVFYLACGALAALAQWYFAAGSTIPSLGASGAIAGVMGAYIIRFPRARVLTLVPLGIILIPFRIPAVFFLGFWFLMQAFNGIASLGTPTNLGMETGGIAYWAHAGGFVFGMVLGPLLGLFAPRAGDGYLR